MQIEQRTTFGLKLAQVGLCLTLLACTRATVVPAPNGQTHWLMSCGDSSVCGDLTCMCGVCAVPCSENTECASLAPDATCHPATSIATQTLCGQVAAQAMCLMPCAHNDDCPDAQACSAGACMPKSTPHLNDVDAGNTYVVINELTPGTLINEPRQSVSSSSNDAGHVMGACVVADTEGWVVETLAADVWFSGQVDSLLDREGKLHVVYPDGPAVMHLVQEGTAWHAEQLDSGDEFAWGIDVAEAPDGTLHIASGGYAGLRHHVRRDGAWQHSQVTSALVRQVSMAIDSDGEPHFVHAHNDSPSLFYTTRVGSQWSSALIDVRGYPRGMTLLLDHPSGPEVIYYADHVRYARRDKGSWQTHSLDEGIDPAAVRVGDTDLFAAWGGHSYSATMTIARLHDGQITRSTVTPFPGGGGVALPALALDHNNALHVLFRTGRGYAYWFVADGVDSGHVELLAADTNVPPSLSVDSNGSPHAFAGTGSFRGDLLHIHQGSCTP